MKRILFTVSILATCGTANSFALNCDCGDWMNKGGYCVDYIKEKIPVFPIPQNTTEIASLKNKPVSEITEGDVAIFNLSNYWHVAYVEKVHRDQKGVARSIDVSEMNFGDRMTRDEFKTKWKSRNEREWQRAVCCGVTDKYDELSFRRNVAVNTVTQVWSPDPDDPEAVNTRKDSGIVVKAKEVLNRFVEYVEQAL
jgi:hypothetical protein